MEIKLTKEQYRNLITLIYLGNWMINAYRLEDERNEDYDEIEQYIFSFAKEVGLEKYIEFSKEFNQFFPTKEFEEEIVDHFIAQYDENNFWEELVNRLARRDFIKEYGEETIKKMSLAERIEKEQPFIERFTKEFEKYGIENLAIKGGKSEPDS